jgi:hypothetical protein
MSNYKEKLEKFVEAEKATGIDHTLLNKLHGYLIQDTLYWSLPPERRNTLNTFYKELHSLLEGELVTGKYGANILIDSIIVTAFEAGYQLGKEETNGLSV